VSDFDPLESGLFSFFSKRRWLTFLFFLLPLSAELREHRKNAPQLIMAQQQEVDPNEIASSDDSSDSSSDDSSDSSDSSSESSSEDEKRRRKSTRKGK
jgi:pre-mRNA-splicing factor CWC22